MSYKIRRDLSRGPRSQFYINVAAYHLPRPRKKEFDFPIIHVSSDFDE